ncbi:MAG: 2-amino-4-hydroxy-6-hydroxymethyldihydropteridine diphosphokinase, partial [candidate division WOR-3 bacterium]
ETDLTPLDLLKCLKSIELNIGRIDRGRWAPREIDLDIIWFSGGEFSHSDLEIPHPRWMERRFVIEPLIDLGFSVLCGIELLDHLQNLMHQVVIPVPCISMRILNLVCNFGSDSLFCENFKK